VSDAHQVRIAQARGQADAAKARLLATVEEAKARLAPKTLAGQAMQAAKDKSIVVADDTVTAVKEKPMMAAGLAGATALFIARKPLFSALGRWWRSGHDEPDDLDLDFEEPEPKRSNSRRRSRVDAEEE